MEKQFVWKKFEDFSAAELYEMLQFRQGVFYQEQQAAYVDLDDHDQKAWHLIARVDDKISGYTRVIIDGKHVSFGRVAVAANRRGQSLGKRLIEEALLILQTYAPLDTITIHAQAHLRPFYRSFGFVETSEPYELSGILHVDMERPARYKDETIEEEER